MSTSEFLRPRFKGRRFEGGRLPLEVLQDLAVLEEMLIAVARWRFLKSHPDRQRSPRGFSRGLELTLTGVAEGSAIPVISLVTTGFLPGFPHDNQRYLTEARDAIVAAIDAAEHSRPIGSHLPDKCLAYFDRFGRSLREGEVVEFEMLARLKPVCLTREVRHRLVAASRIRELTEEVSLRGSVPEADQDAMTFELQLVDGRKVPGPMPDQHMDSLLEAFNGYQQGARVVVHGIGKLTKQHKLQKLESIEEVTILEALDVPARLEELALLRDGWLEGRGRAPSRTSLEWLTGAFEERFPDALPLPHVYPMEDGGVRMEWSLGTNEVSIDIDLEEQHGQWHRLDTVTDAEELEDLTLGNDAGWARLAELLTSLSAEEP